MAEVTNPADAIRAGREVQLAQASGVLLPTTDLTPEEAQARDPADLPAIDAEIARTQHPLGRAVLQEERARIAGAPPPAAPAAPKRPPTWDAVTKLPAIQNLPFDQREAARHQYFVDVVAPLVPTDQLGAARAAFDSDTKPGILDEAIEKLGALMPRSPASRIPDVPSWESEPIGASAVSEEEAAARRAAIDQPARMTLTRTGQPILHGGRVVEPATGAPGEPTAPILESIKAAPEIFKLGTVQAISQTARMVQDLDQQIEDATKARDELQKRVGQPYIAPDYNVRILAGEHAPALTAEEELHQRRVMHTPADTLGSYESEVKGLNTTIATLTQQRDHYAKISELVGKDIQEATPKNQGMGGKMVTTAAQSLAPTAAGLAVGAVNPALGVVIGAGGGSVMQAAQAYDQTMTAGEDARKRLPDFTATPDKLKYIRDIAGNQEADDTTRKAATNALEQISSNAEARAGGLMSNDAEAQSNAAAVEKFGADLKHIASNATIRTAKLNAAIQGVAEYVGEQFGLEAIMKPGSKLLPKLAESLATNFGQEFATQAVQSLAQRATYDPTLTLKDALEQMLIAGGAGAVTAGPTTVGSHVLQKAIEFASQPRQEKPAAPAAAEPGQGKPSGELPTVADMLGGEVPVSTSPSNEAPKTDTTGQLATINAQLGVVATQLAEARQAGAETQIEHFQTRAKELITERAGLESQQNPDVDTEGLQRQNRDQTRAASVAQMQAIANAPDYDRLATSPIPDVGAPMVSVKGDETLPAADLGKSATVTLGDGTKMPVRYAVVEADSVLASHDVNGKQNPEYFENVIPKGKIVAMTNGRVAGFQGAVARGTTSSYTEKLLADPEHGVSAEAIKAKKNPMLVRVYDDAYNALPRLAQLSNTGGSAQFSDVEKARNDATALDSLDGLVPTDSGDMTAAANMPFVRRFMQAIPENERPEMLTATGELSQAGAKRLRAAVFAKAYGGGEALQRMVESTDDNVRSITAGLMRAAPAVARLREKVAAGALHPLDITPELLRAVEDFARLKADGSSVGAWLAQADMFGALPQEISELMGFLEDNARSGRRIADFLERYLAAAEAIGNPAQGGMFEQKVPGKADLVRGIVKEIANERTNGLPEGAQPVAAVVGERAQGGEGEGASAVPGADSVRAETPAASGAQGVAPNEQGVDHALKARQRTESYQREHPGISPGPDLRGDQGQIREADRGQTGRSGGAIERQARAQADAGGGVQPGANGSKGNQVAHTEFGTPEHAAAQKAARESAKAIFADYEKAKAAYVALPESNGGTIFNPDIASELVPEYVANRELASEVHDAASDFIKRYYAERLKEPTPAGERPVVVFTAGGPGSGKSAATAQALGKTKAELLYDSSLSRFDSAKARIDQALNSGRSVDINFVDRNPVAAYEHGVIARVQKGLRRVVPVGEHTRSHVEARNVIKQLAENYANDRRVIIRTVSNNGGITDAKTVGLNEVQKLEYNRVHEEVKRIGERAVENGRLTAAQFRHALEDATWRPDRGGSGEIRGRLRGSDGAGAEGQRDGREDVPGIAPLVVRNGKARYEVNQPPPPKEGTPADREKAAAIRDLFSEEALPGAPPPGSFDTLVALAKRGEIRVNSEKIDSPESAAHAFAALRKDPRERFQVLVLDKNDKPIAALHLFAGTVAQASVYPREILTAVYQTPGAAKIWMAHNHPSGIAEPSNADDRLTRDISKGLGKDIGVELAGHVIIAGKRAVAFDNNGPMKPAFDIPTGTRKFVVPIMERTIRKQNLGAKAALSSPAAVRDYLRTSGKTEPGLVLMDAQHRLTGWLPMSLAEAQKLRTGDANTGAGRLFRTIGVANPAAAVFYSPQAQDLDKLARAVDNLSGALNLLDVRVLDAMAPQGGTNSKALVSLAEKGTIGAGVGNTFLSRSGALRRNDLHTGLSGITVPAVNAVADVYRKAFKGLPEVHVMQAVSDAPEALRADITKLGGEDDTAGAWHKGEVYLFADNLSSPQHAEWVLLHESTHHGLRGLLGERLKPVLMAINAQSAEVRKLANEQRQRNPNLSTVAATEEALANMGADQIPQGVIARVVAAVRRILRQMGFKLQLSDGDVRALVAQALRFVKDQPKATTVMSGTALHPGEAPNASRTATIESSYGNKPRTESSGFRDADSLRNRAATARSERTTRLAAKGISESQVGVEPPSSLSRTVGQLPTSKSNLGLAPANRGLIGHYVNVANKVIDFTDRLSNPLVDLPGQADYLGHRQLTMGVIDRGNDIVKTIKAIFKDVTAADRRAAVDYFTTAGATTAKLSPELRRGVENIKKLINEMSDKLVATGVISAEAREQFRDRYLPQLYLKWLLDDKHWKAAGVGKKASEMGYTKERKLVQFRDAQGNMKLKERGTGKVLSDEQVLSLGPVTDPAFLASVAISRGMRDMAILDWLGKISEDARWVLPNTVVAWNGQKVSPYFLKEEANRLRKQADHYGPGDAKKTRDYADRMDAAADKAIAGMPQSRENYLQIPNTARYGGLRGIWVREEIYHDLMGSTSDMSVDQNWFKDWFSTGGKGETVTRWWKATKTILNLPGQLRNVATNFSQLQLDGIGYHKMPFVLAKAVKEIRSNGAYFKEFKAQGGRGGTFSNQELGRMERDLLDLQGQKLNTLQTIHRMAAIVYNASGDAWQAVEVMGKMMAFVDARDGGATASKAMARANKVLFDYSLVPNWVRYARRVPFGIAFACVDDTTEALTKDGWKGIDAIKEDDMIASFDMKTERLSWRRVNGVYRSTYDGKMVRVLDRHLDMLLTPDHRCVSYRTRRVVGMREFHEKYRSLEIVRADALNVADHIPVAAQFDREAEGALLSDGLVKVLAWVATEGWFHNKCAMVYIFQNAANAQRIRDALTEAGMTWGEQVQMRAGTQHVCNGVTFRHNDDYVQLHVHAAHGRVIRDLLPGKKLTPSLLHRLTAPQLELLIQTMVDGDGSRAGSQVTFIQKKGETSEAFKMALVMAGRSFGVHERPDGIESISLRQGEQYCIARATKNEVQYKGRVWCPEVPGTGTWLARRDGKVFITGNTWNAKVLPRLVETALKYPHRFLPYVAFFYGAQFALASMLGVGYDDLERLKKAMPEWLRDKRHAVLLPWKDAQGRWEVLDVGYIMPWTNWLQLATDTGKLATDAADIKKVMNDIGAFSGPIPNVIAAMSTGQDPFTHRDIIHKGDPAARQWASLANYAWSMAAPPFLSDTGALGHGIRAWTETTNKFGDPIDTPTQAGLRMFGINRYALQPEQARAANELKMKREIEDSVQAAKQRLQDRSLPPEKRTAIAEEYRTEAQRRQQKLLEYIRESGIHPRLQTQH